MRVRWTEPAFRGWEETFAYIEADNPTAARRIAGKVLDAVEMLTRFPFAGRVGLAPDTREFAVSGSFFLIIYAVEESNSVLKIIAVYDGRRQWPEYFPPQ